MSNQAQEVNVLHKVHKNVRYMISEIRQIMKARYFMSKVHHKDNNSKNISNAAEQSSLVNINMKQSNLLDRYKYIRSKERPYISQLKPSQKLQTQKSKQHKKSKVHHGIGHKQSPKYDSKNLSPFSKFHPRQIANQPVSERSKLPSIKNVENQRYRKSLNCCQTTSPQEIQASQRQIYKNIKTVESKVSGSPCEAQAKRRRFNSQVFRSQQQEIKSRIYRQNFKGLTYEPWQNKQQPENELIE